MRAALFIMYTCLAIVDGRFLQQGHNQTDIPPKINAQSLERFLKTALEDLALESQRSSNTNNQYPKIVSSTHSVNSQFKPYVDISKSSKNPDGNRDDKRTKAKHGNAIKPFPTVDRVAPLNSNIVLTHRLGPSVRPRAHGKQNLPSWNYLKMLVREEFMKDKKQQSLRGENTYMDFDKNSMALPLSNEDPNIADDDDRDNTGLPLVDDYRDNPGLPLVDDYSEKDDYTDEEEEILDDKSISFTGAKNWLIFGIGFGCSTMTCMLCILGFHCVRYMKYKDGFFMRKAFQPSTPVKSTCMNNNNDVRKADYLTGQCYQPEENGWSSEEEVFNVSIPRSCHESLPNSPNVKRGSSVPSTPIIFKTKQTYH